MGDGAMHGPWKEPMKGGRHGASEPAGAPEKSLGEPEVLRVVFVALEAFKAGTKAPASMGWWLECVVG